MRRLLLSWLIGTAACGKVAGRRLRRQLRLLWPRLRRAGDRPYLLERVSGEASVVQLYADGFNELSLKEKR
jgi:hypothetical protein